MTRLSPVIRKLIDTGLTLGDVSSRNLGGTAQERVRRVCKEAIGLGFSTIEQIAAYASSNLPEATVPDIELALNHLICKRYIVRDGGKYVTR